MARTIRVTVLPRRQPMLPPGSFVTITGSAIVGETLTANIDSLGGEGPASFQWRRGATNIGTNSGTYVVQPTDVGSTITVTVTRSGNSGWVTSDTTGMVTASLVRVQGGTFLMGNCPSGNNMTPMCQVTLSSFYISRFQLTQGEWYDVMGTRPSWFTGDTNRDGIPVTGVNGET